MADKNNFPIILVVDDEPAVLETLEFILDKDFKVLTAKSGKEALEKINQGSIDLVFLDINLPDMDGMEVLQKIKETDENLLVIMATATEKARTVVQALQMGACNYLAKPFDVEEVVAVAKKAIEHEKLRREVIPIPLTATRFSCPLTGVR